MLEKAPAVKSSLLPSLALLVAGCGTVGVEWRAATEPEPVVTTGRGQYRPGEVASLNLNNPLDERIGYNACTWTLERQRDEGWEPAPYEDERACTMELRTLEPGDTANPGFRFDERLPDGRYRFRAILHLLDSGTRTVHRSGSFLIHRQPE